MDAEILRQIADNTQPKKSMSILVSGNETKLSTRFNPPLQLDPKKKYEIALINLETYHSIPNVDATNNYFRYSPDNQVTWFDIHLPVGSYDIVDLHQTLVQKMKANGHYDDANEQAKITISANTSTLKSLLVIAENFAVDFRENTSLNSVLGFNNQVYESGSHDSEQVVNIMQINSVFVKTDVIGGSYVNGQTRNVIYNFYPDVSPGYKILQNPNNLVYLPVILDTISSVVVELTDQNFKQLNLRGENLTIRFHLREA